MLKNYRVIRDLRSLITRVAVGMGFPMGMGMGMGWGCRWEMIFPRGNSHMGIPMSFPYGNSHVGKPMGIPMWKTHGIPMWETHGNSPCGKTHGNSHMGKPMGIPTVNLVGMGWEWELKFLSHGNPANHSWSFDFDYSHHSTTLSASTSNLPS